MDFKPIPWWVRVVLWFKRPIRSVDGLWVVEAKWFRGVLYVTDSYRVPPSSTS